jgi:hypothetical protein
MPASPPNICLRPTWRPLLALGALALSLHGMLLGEGLGGDGVEAPAVPAGALHVRTLAATPAVEPEQVPVPAPSPSPAAKIMPARAPAAREPAAAIHLAAVRPRPSAPPRKVELPPMASALADEAGLVATAEAPHEPTPSPSLQTASAAEPQALVGAAAASAPTAGKEVPVYRTVMPPATTLHYELRRGMLSGSGELSWRPAGQRYEARLEGRVVGINVLSQASQGSFDAAGIAPLRYTDRRPRRGTSAANFQRDKGKISYSGPSTEFPLVPGAQDRVSWMIQLAAVLNAKPQRAAPGGTVVFFVSGARGDADVWTFRQAGQDTVQTEAGPVRAVKFTREARGIYDTLVEVWLAPAFHYLPVRAKLTTMPDGDALELLLRDMQSP